ncbi:DUF1223 domain-containing protein [Shimia sp. MMG029]|uniref:DUF1223 domain-containing protein n=1 Tax=Shimia sp. MMG029 TaxID=3021978 RepID=UPI0022FDBC76|nr:DUF1223 domain-containing protein [Shimia sp. MMG029]MDA5555562.1 DUF1223 domain-containing protein [Shimia sp. MMG029]
MIRTTAIFATLWLSLASTVAAQESPVVVELYTSQGCSSCPPADAYLREQLAGREDVIALALHVDYWDYIGWKDEFANPAFTQRQHSYARAAGHRSVYTPQMIVNGQDHVVGAHPNKVERLIEAHKAAPELVDLQVIRNGATVSIAASTELSTPMNVHVVRYRPAEKVSIKRGENAGKVFSYANIVDDWQNVRRWTGRSDLAMEVSIDGSAPLVVLIQRENGGPIVAAARLK